MWDDRTDRRYYSYERPYEERRIFGFRGPPQPHFMGYSSQKPGTFSNTEIQHLLVALGILTVAFTFLFTNGIFIAMSYPGLFAFYLPLSFVAVATAFLCHELGHKFLAQKYGYWAEFRYNLQYLLLGLGMAAMFGFLFVGPGAVYIRGNPTRSENGKLSAAGPGINILIAAIFLGIVLLFPFNSYIVFLSLTVGVVNSFLAGFNMIPGWIFDGAKIWRWNIGIYFVMWVFIIILAIFHFGIFYSVDWVIDLLP